MKCEIVTTGTELLLGEIVDTNAVFIARTLRDGGLNLYYKTTVGDNRARLANTLRLGLSRSEVIIVTGGLGPTVDDITREAIADATARPLELRPDLADHLRMMFASWGRGLTENNLRQAFVPRDALVIPNPNGTAPGFVVDTSEGVIICMPGVPREMKAMMLDWVLPYLQKRQGTQQQFIKTRTIHTVGIGESAIDDKIKRLMEAENPTVGLAAHLGRADIRITAAAATEADAQALILPVEEELHSIFGDLIYGVDDDSLGSVIGEQLRSAQATLAIAETNTAGCATDMMQEGAVEVLKQWHERPDLNTLSSRIPSEQPIGIDRESAEHLASVLQDYTSATYAMVILGTTDASHGFWSKERGETWVALKTPEGTLSHHFEVGGGDEFTQHWLAIYALDFLRKHLLGKV